MSMVKKTISITAEQSEWLNRRIGSGHYEDDSELIQELISERQLLEDEMNNPAEVERIRELLIEGEESGFRQVISGELLADFKRELHQNEKV